MWNLAVGERSLVVGRKTEDLEVLNPDEAAAFLKVSRRTLMKEWVPKRMIPVIRPHKSNRTLFLKSDLVDFLLASRRGYEVGIARRQEAKGKAKSRRRVKARR